jgi:hypothetical protein
MAFEKNILVLYFVQWINLWLVVYVGLAVSAMAKNVYLLGWG